jgi:hypothetical protein
MVVTEGNVSIEYQHIKHQQPPVASSQDLARFTTVYCLLTSTLARFSQETKFGIALPY